MEDESIQSNTQIVQQEIETFNPNIHNIKEDAKAQHDRFVLISYLEDGIPLMKIKEVSEKYNSTVE